ncbi:MAG: 16S rRNA (cytidine(1402)-2'-O)-methyltransferase [Puniceicoccaceae bacterium]|nr:MAG: 16S rRNA (cytidine(1402)-2'-O)-methyltransferase [Puniceicoccaceae bacterium]
MEPPSPDPGAAFPFLKDNASLEPRPGHLYVIATPLGNLADLSFRGLALLVKCSAIVCEDSRVTGKLIQALGLPRRPLLSAHEHNETARLPGLIERLRAGESLALVSDAGTPTLSDPGFRIVREARRQGLPVVPVPGPFAAATLLSASGLPTHAFFFAGFLPPKSTARRNWLESHRDADHTLLLYESCHRIGKLLGDIREVLGPDRVVAVGRELTKRFEHIGAGTVGTLAPDLLARSLKGEFTIAIAPAGFSL